jgi:hypothetical protein
MVPLAEHSAGLTMRYDHYSELPERAFIVVCGRMTYEGGGKGDSPAPPDYTSVAAASEETAKIGAELGREQLAENKRQYDTNYAVARPIVDKQSALMDQQISQGNDYYGYAKSISRPAETSMFYEAMGLSPDEIKQYQALRSQETQTANGQRTALINKATTATPAPVAVSSGLTAAEAKELSDLMAQVGSGAPKAPVKPYVGAPQWEPSVGADDYGARDAMAAYQQAMADYQASSADLPAKQARLEQLLSKQSAAGSGASVASSAPVISNPGASIAEDTSASDAYLANASAAANQRLEENAAAQAMADSRAGTTQQANMIARQGLRYGFSPQKMSAMSDAAVVANASNQAAAANSARTQQKAINWGKRSDVSNSVKGLPGTSQNAYSLANQSGNSAVGNQNQTAAQYINGMNAGTGTIMQGQQAKMTGLGSILNSQTSSYNAGISNQESSPWGSLIGAAGGVAAAFV